jgi:hypothetical protein
MNRVIFFIILILIVAFTGCKSKQPTIAKPEKKDITLALGYWNADDSKNTAEKLVKRMLSDRWRTEFMYVNKGMRPILIVGLVKNLGSEKADSILFTKDIEKSIIKGDLVRFVQSSGKHEILFRELRNNTDKDTLTLVSNWASRMGSHFVVNATILSNSEIKRKEKIVQYRVKLELIYCETKQPVWLGEEILSKKVLLK